MVPWWGQFLKHKKAMKRILLKMFFKYKGGLKAQKKKLNDSPRNSKMKGKTINTMRYQTIDK